MLLNFQGTKTEYCQWSIVCVIDERNIYKEETVLAWIKNDLLTYIVINKN